MESLREKISCARFLTLIERSLKAGYVDCETKILYKTDKGTLQGSVISPILANIVLDKLDKYIDEYKTE